MIVSQDQVRALCMAAFTSQGVPDADAAVTVDALVEANLRGHDSHGVVRVPKWVDGLRHGAITAHCQPTIVRDSGPAVLLDGDAGLGPVVAARAYRLAVERSKVHGIAAVSVRNASHIGMLGYYADTMARLGVVGMIMTNTESGVAPFGSRDKILGTNPLALGCPTRTDPVVLDMSTSVVARGKVVLAEREGKSIPDTWAIDQDGRPTTDPAAALKGALLPIAGPKGSGLSFFVDVLTGGLSGMAVGRDVKGTLDMRSPGTKGDFFLALDPGFFGGHDLFVLAVESLLNQIRSATPADGHAHVFAPGDKGRQVREQRLKDGLSLDDALIEELRRIPLQPKRAV